ncbi:MAG: hypothetical protein L6406_14400 [Desulfobacterales bacterium]|nr:hypothetical protein [Desulfobacterales bacterium]
MLPTAEVGDYPGLIRFAYLEEGATFGHISNSHLSFQKPERRVEAIDRIKQNHLIQFDVTLFRMADDIENPFRGIIEGFCPSITGSERGCVYFQPLPLYQEFGTILERLIKPHIFDIGIDHNAGMCLKTEEAREADRHKDR